MSGRGGGGRRPEGRGGGGGGGRGRGRDSGGGGGGRDGGGRGRGGGGGRSGGFPVPSPATSYSPAIPPSSHSQTLSYQPPASPSPATNQPAPTPTPAVSQAASSSSVAALSRDVDQQLTLKSPDQESASSSSEAALPPVSSKATRFPARPGYGTVGRKCVIRANHFLVQVADSDLHHYDVTITPEVASKKVNRLVITELIHLYRESHLGKRIPAYDGRKTLYTAGPLPFRSKEFIVKLDNDGPAGPARREREFKVAIKFAARADLHQLQQFLRRRQLDCPQETIQALDVVLRESPSKEYTVVGRSFFSTTLGPTGPLDEGLEYWKGFYQSLRPTQMGLSINIDVSARSFYQPILVTEFVAKYFNVKEALWPLTDRDRIKLSRALKGVKVEVTHTEYTKMCKIAALSIQPTSELTFPIDDGNQKSVVQYFRERYNIELKYAYLPCLQTGSGAKLTYVPMELAKIVQGQRYTKKLNESQVTTILKATCQRPRDREASIKQMVKTNYDTGGDVLSIRSKRERDDLVRKEFGIEVSNELSVVDARVLPPPRLKYHDSGKEKNVDPHVGQWNMINKKMVNGGTLEHWTCVNFSSRVRQDLVHRFCEELVGMCASKGMSFNPNPLVPILTANAGQLEKTLLDVQSKSTAKLASMGQKDKRLQLLIIILPDVTGSYGKIKRICETELGIVSQCCQPRQVQKLNKQYFENVSLKINVKVGGRNTVLFDAVQRRLPVVSEKPTIIFGADVTHPQPGEDASASIAAVVASMDWPEVTKYRGLVSSQPHREEIICNLHTVNRDPQRGEVHGGMIRELLIAFLRSTKLKPHRIIFYRDGVSEGQFSQVLLHEMDAIRKACASLEEGYLPPVTFVVVQKRHHTRFFPTDPNGVDRSGNVLPGTVVDSKICHPTEFDFYLNSHAGIQGTSRPAHYHVLFDENKFTADGLQTLTNNLCYTYARCTRAVSIVPPAYYAHLAAFRARYYIEGNEASDSGSASGNRNTRERTAITRSLPSIKENVKDVMFFC